METFDEIVSFKVCSLALNCFAEINENLAESIAACLDRGLEHSINEDLESQKVNLKDLLPLTLRKNLDENLLYQDRNMLNSRKQLLTLIKKTLTSPYHLLIFLF